MDVVTLQRSKHYIEDLNKMRQGAAVGIGSAEQCPQHQEAEREWQADEGSPKKKAGQLICRFKQIQSCFTCSSTFN